MRTFELLPQGRQKSFYGKATVFCTGYGLKILKSYETFVALLDREGNLHRLWGGWSATTSRHLESFTKKYQGKKSWDSMEVENINTFELTEEEKPFFTGRV